MVNELVNSEENLPTEAFQKEVEQFLTVWVEKQLFGIPVLKIKDVLKTQRITKIPLSGPEVKGYMNLRGRIVTVIDVRVKLGLQPPELDSSKEMFVVVEHQDDLYCLIVDSVGDSKTLPLNEFEKNPVNLAPVWKSVSKGVFKRKKEIMLVLDLETLIGIE